MPRTDRDINRREILQGMGAAGVVGLAGCIGDDDDEIEDDDTDDDTDPGTDDDTDPGTDDDTDEEETDLDEIHDGGELVIGLAENIADFDPVSMNDTTSGMTVRTLLYEGLTAIDFEGDPHPGLAEDWEQIDDTTFEFYLREGVQFHNGEELHAEQVKRSFERYEGELREPDVYEWYEDSEVVDDHTLEVHLSQPDATMITGLAGVPILPDELLDGDTDPDEHPIGTGAYQFEEFEDGDVFRASRFEDHWFEGSDSVPETPPIEEITCQIIREDASRSSALQTGDVHHSFGLASDTLDDFDASDEFDLTSTPAGGYEFMSYPVQFEPWDNANIRAGVDRLIPRPIIIEEVYHGWAERSDLPFAEISGMDEFIPDDFREEMFEEYGGYDIDEAVELIEEGFDEEGIDAPLDVNLVVNADNDDRVQWTELVAESMEQSGMFDVELETFEWTEYVARVTGPGSEENNEIVTIGLSAGFDPDSFIRATMYTGRQTPGCCNIHHYSNDELDDLIETGRHDPDVAFDTDARAEVYQEATELIMQEAPVSFTQFGTEIDIVRAGEVHGWETHPINSYKIIKGIYAPESDQVAWLDPDAA